MESEVGQEAHMFAVPVDRCVRERNLSVTEGFKEASPEESSHHELGGRWRLLGVQDVSHHTSTPTEQTRTQTEVIPGLSLCFQRRNKFRRTGKPSTHSSGNRLWGELWENYV